MEKATYGTHHPDVSPATPPVSYSQISPAPEQTYPEPQHPQPAYSEYPQLAQQPPSNHQYHDTKGAVPPAQQQGPVYQTVMPIPALGIGAAPVDCPACGQRALTKVDHKSGGFTHGIAALLCCLFCAGCLPYFFDGMKNVEHRCGRCGVLLATFHRNGGTEVHMHQ